MDEGHPQDRQDDQNRTPPSYVAPARSGPAGDEPPRPAAPARRRPTATIRERVDAELRTALLVSVAPEPRRPTKGWDRMARRETRPAGVLPERIEEYVAHGGDVPRLFAELHAAVDRVRELVVRGIAHLGAAHRSA